MANASLKAAFERMWQHTVVALDKKVDKTDISPSDWLASEGEAGHVLNRTHYVNSSEDIIIVPETTVTAGRSGQIAWRTFPMPRLVPGDKYIINWNGVDYPCTARVTDNERPTFVLGYHPRLVTKDNTSEDLVSEMYDESIPIGWVFHARYSVQSVSKDYWESRDFTIRSFSIAAEGETVTYSVRKVKEDVEKIDNKFIDADWMATSKLVELVPETTFTPTEHTLASEGSYCWEPDVTEVPSYASYINAVGTPKTFYVVFDGDTYYVDEKKLSILTAWGNVAFYGDTSVSQNLPEYTGLPFCIVNVLSVPYVFTGDSNEHTIAIYAVKSNKIPNRFLPDDIANNDIANSATQVQIVTWGADD